MPLIAFTKNDQTSSHALSPPPSPPPSHLSILIHIPILHPLLHPPHLPPLHPNNQQLHRLLTTPTTRPRRPHARIQPHGREPLDARARIPQVRRVRPRHLRQHEELLGRVPGVGAEPRGEEVERVGQSDEDVEQQDGDGEIVCDPRGVVPVSWLYDVGSAMPLGYGHTLTCQEATERQTA